MGKSLQHGLGLLEYDDDSPHIIRRLPLTSNDVAGIGGATVIGTETGTFDSVKGYKPYYTDGISTIPANGHLYWLASSNPLIPANLIPRILGGYTISVEVETTALIGATTASILAELVPATATAKIRTLVNATTGAVQVNNHSGEQVLKDTSQVLFLPPASRHPDDDFYAKEYTRVYVSVSTGGQYNIFFGNKWMVTAEFAEALVSDANPLNSVRLGGGALGETVNGYMRNLFIMDRPINIPWDLSIGRIAISGDSIIEQAGSISSSTNYAFSSSNYPDGLIGGWNVIGDYILSNEVHRRLSEAGRYSQPYNFGRSGATYADQGGVRVLDQLDKTASIAQCRDLRPDVWASAAGTNDVSSLSITMDDTALITSFGHGLRETLDKALSFGFIKGIVLGNVMSRNHIATSTEQQQIDVLLANGLLETIMAEYQGLYPNVKFIIADRYTAFGGASPDATLYKTNEVHLSIIGHYTQGKVISEAILALGL